MEKPFGQQIRAAREAQDITLRALAKQIGVVPSYLHAIEMGQKTATERIRSQLLGALAVDLARSNSKHEELRSTFGRRFGALVVLAEQEPNDLERGLLRCRCDCNRAPWVTLEGLPILEDRTSDCGGLAHRWTYALLAETQGRVKIGSASQLRFDARINDIQLMCPVELTLIGKLDRNIEGELHAALASHRLHGEWFTYTTEVAVALETELIPVGMSLLLGKW